MSDSSQHISERQQLYDAALVAVHKAAHDRSTLAVTKEAQALADRYPESGLTTRDIQSYLEKVAGDHRIPIAIG